MVGTLVSLFSSVFLFLFLFLFRYCRLFSSVHCLFMCTSVNVCCCVSISVLVYLYVHHSHTTAVCLSVYHCRYLCVPLCVQAPRFTPSRHLQDRRPVRPPGPGTGARVRGAAGQTGGGTALTGRRGGTTTGRQGDRAAGPQDDKVTGRQDGTTGRDGRTESEVCCQGKESKDQGAN